MLICKKNLQVVGEPIHKAWTKDALKGLYNREIRKAKKTEDDRRSAELTAYARGGTGGGPGREPLQQLPADELPPPRVDPRLLTAREPIRDELTVVNVPAGSCFASNMDQSGVISRVAQPPRMRRDTPASSGAYEAPPAAAASQSTSAGQAVGSAEVLQTIVVELAEADLEWAQELLNNSMESLPSLSPPR